ncbi:inorganic phosphate transporter [Colwellia psychrerythraea]|uniref:Phosphate transporter n=1 Tax=Colwellia psychrerythraea TaxID=28229 RepID=A0A099KUI7_COLPS|nr:inorganic phosphate transporter [Colwellia psychrerythraea]KGJ93860.1 phosphate transporter [Colwellia psychrerythraea]
MLIMLLVFTTIFLAYSNGANDNFKGVATLYGSGTLSYKTAITIATVTTFIGSIAAIFLAQGLVASFSGKGLVPVEIAGTASFLIATGLGAAITVLLAARLSFPISTTHSLVGGLLGAGIAAVGMEVNFQQLGSAFFFPLLASPFIAFSLGMIVYWLFNQTRRRLKLNKEGGIYIHEKTQLLPVNLSNNGFDSAGKTLIQQGSFHQHHDLQNKQAMLMVHPLINTQQEVASLNSNVNNYTGKVLGFSNQKILDTAHIMSGAAVSFARGLNDTPKIAGLLVAAQTLDINIGMIAIAFGMAIGGLLNARRVAETMSKKITVLNSGQGFSANLVTSFMVIVASKFGVPVSTTHVSVGAIFGIGMLGKKTNGKVIGSIILSWIMTLPVAMIFSAILYILIA